MPCPSICLPAAGWWPDSFLEKRSLLERKTEDAVLLHLRKPVIAEIDAQDLFGLLREGIDVHLHPVPIHRLPLRFHGFGPVAITLDALVVILDGFIHVIDVTRGELPGVRIMLERLIRGVLPLLVGGVAIGSKDLFERFIPRSLNRLHLALISRLIIIELANLAAPFLLRLQ